MHWHLVGLSTALALLWLRRTAARGNALLLILLSLPSTFLHELAHYLIALVLGGNPSRFSLWPTAQRCIRADGREEKVWTLGSVTFQKSPLATLPAALAPLLYLPVVWYLITAPEWSLPMTGGPETVAVDLTSYAMLAAAVPSYQDIKVALTDLKSLLLYGLLGYALWRWWEEIKWGWRTLCG